jgi:hypothetical protein
MAIGRFVMSAKLKSKGEKMKKQDNEIVYEFVLTKLMTAYDDTRRGKKGAIEKADKLGAELVRRGLLTQEQADNLRKW